ncbi:MAG: TetR/AcrR family transcriptional regulator [Sandaracinaceae bacterium]|nr:TetR/AcrR family transcriptional regulator [Sandaracinaceae bacterium]
MALPRFEKLDEPRKKSILAAAAEELNERGFEGASYNHIIERAGISKGAMYYYFADKDDLYRTVLDAAIALFFEQVGFPFAADDAESFWRGCEQMYERTLRFVLEDPNNASLCLAITRARERMEGHPVLLELNQRMLEWTRALVQQGQALGAVRTDVPSELLVHVGLSIMDAGDRWLAGRLREITAGEVESTAKMLVDLFRRVGATEGSR